MTIVGGLDVHRQQITFDYLDDRRVVHWGQIRPATRKALRGWLGERCGGGDGEFALEGCTGWRYVSRGAGGGGRGRASGGSRPRSRRCGAGRSGPRPMEPMPGCNPTLLVAGRLPKSWIPPEHVLEARALGRLYAR